MIHDKEYDSMEDYEFSIMSHLKDDETDSMNDYEFSIMNHLKEDY